MAEVEAAAAAFCAQPWSAVASPHATQPWSAVASPHASSYCFSGAYIPSLLSAYGFSAASRAVTYARTLGGADVEWALGAQAFYLQQARAQIEAAGAPGAPSAAGAEPLHTNSTGIWATGAAIIAFAGILLGALIGASVHAACVARGAKRPLLHDAELKVARLADRSSAI